MILDGHERIGDSWRHRWDSLRVFTPARYNGLPGWSFPAPAWSYPSKDDVADYLEAYAARFRLPVRTGIRVDGLARDGDAYAVTSGPHRYRATNVVVATGGYPAPRIPAFAADLDPSIVQTPLERVPEPVATARRQRPGGRRRDFPGAEIALELSARHRTWLSGRDTGQEPFRRREAMGPVVHAGVLVRASRTC